METLETPQQDTRPMLSIRQKNGHVLTTDLSTLGPMLAYYRLRRGMTRTELSVRALTASSSTIKDIEAGVRGISNRNLALRMTVALGLDPQEADHFLHVAGFATVVDWQQFAHDILVDLGLGSVYEEAALDLYARAARQDRRAHRQRGAPDAG